MQQHPSESILVALSKLARQWKRLGCFAAARVRAGAMLCIALKELGLLLRVDEV